MMKRGEVYYADLNMVVGSEQGGIRPVVIVQNDSGNKYSPTTIIVPMTSKKKHELPTHVRIGSVTPLLRSTIIMAEQIKTIDKSRIRNFVCCLDDETMDKLDEAIKISLALYKEEKGVETRELDELRVFKSEEFGTLRVALKDDKAWFVAKDISVALKYESARDCVEAYVDNEHRGMIQILVDGNVSNFVAIDYLGVCTLVLNSCFSKARKFSKWIEWEVIPKMERKEDTEMNDLKIFSNEEIGLKVRALLNKDGSISISAEDTAIGFGWTQEKNGKTYVKWERMNGFCREFGFSPLVGKDDYIPESLFYRLGMKANNPAAERFQNWLAMEVIPSIRKTGSYQKPMTPEEMMRVQLGMIDGHEERISKLENTMNVDYGQQRVLEKEVAKAVIDSLGGKDSPAYREMGKKVFAECNHDVKDYFHVNSRNNIPRLRFDDAVEYIRNWTPCTNTRVSIQECNAQIMMKSE